MKSRFFSSAKMNGFEGEFKNLDENEMINLRGGHDGEPPLPPSGGEDFPIDLLKPGMTNTLLTVQRVPALPVLPVLPVQVTVPYHRKR